MKRTTYLTDFYTPQSFHCLIFFFFNFRNILYFISTLFGYIYF